MKIIYPGSFNPWHAGHQYVYDEACKIVGKDNVFLGVARNDEKKEVNLEWLMWTLAPTGAKMIAVKGATVDACREHGIDYIIRGVRPSYDLPHEASMDWWNMRMSGGKVGTLFVFTPEGMDHVSSSAIKLALKLKHVDAVEDLVDPYILSRFTSGRTVPPKKCIFFGRSCVGKSTWIKANVHKVVDCDQSIWNGFGSVEMIGIKAVMKMAIEERDRELFDKTIKRIAETVNWHEFFILSTNEFNFDAAAIGVYFKYIPKEVFSQFLLVRLTTSEEKRLERARSKSFEDKLEGLDWAYQDTPFWDKEITI